MRNVKGSLSSWNEKMLTSNLKAYEDKKISSGGKYMDK